MNLVPLRLLQRIIMAAGASLDYQGARLCINPIRITPTTNWATVTVQRVETLKPGCAVETPSSRARS